jgi:hypothetical protein
MEITRSSVKDATVSAINPAQEEGKSTLTLIKPEDKSFANTYGANGLNVNMANEKIENLGIEVGTKVDFEEVGYHLLTAAKYEEVRDGAIPKNIKAYILTEMVNRMELCDQGKITPRQRDEYFSVVKEHINLSQTKTHESSQGK